VGRQYLPTLLSSRLRTQERLVLLLNWDTHFLDQSYAPEHYVTNDEFSQGAGQGCVTICLNLQSCSTANKSVSQSVRHVNST